MMYSSMCVVVLGGRVRWTVPDIFVAKSDFFYNSLVRKNQ